MQCQPGWLGASLGAPQNWKGAQRRHVAGQGGCQCAGMQRRLGADAFLPIAFHAPATVRTTSHTAPARLGAGSRFRMRATPTPACRCQGKTRIVTPRNAGTSQDLRIRCGRAGMRDWPRRDRLAFLCTAGRPAGRPASRRALTGASSTLSTPESAPAVGPLATGPQWPAPAVC